MFFSVIVPIYCMEAYLGRCVDSILAQSVSDFEAILVDDGSPDGCPAICDAYAAADRRVRVLHKPNGGLVSARQAGIQAASGDYVVYVDADDWIAPDLLERARALIRAYDADIVSFGVSHIRGADTWETYEPVPEGFYDRAALERELYPRLLLSRDMERTLYYLCGKAIRRSLVKGHQLRVPREIALGEDVSCLMPTYLDARRVYISKERMYFCRYRTDSMTRSFSLEQYDQLSLGIELLRHVQAPDGEDFQRQVDRYGVITCMILMEYAIMAGRADLLPGIVERMNRPGLRACLTRAVFHKITPKTRVVCFLYRQGRLKAAFYILRLCRRIKGDLRR